MRKTLTVHNKRVWVLKAIIPSLNDSVCIVSDCIYQEDSHRNLCYFA